ncbi:hypothetical protein [Streptomyces sp. NPDC058330]|uniref:hypothetical protein n=1 Tax=Streptomyces sp. NPDC058330 TaxID=3346449 RepID=UPI0036E90793
MTRQLAVPSELRVRAVLEELRRQAADEGKAPSVLALARKLGLSNTTFRRHFPHIAREVTESRSSSGGSSGEERQSRLDMVVARNAKLKITNRTLKGHLKLAAAQIQRLASENAQLRQALEASAKVSHIGPARQPRP